MEEFQKVYIQKMGSRIEAFIAAGKGLDQNFDESAVSIRRMAHSLRGSGATYGFPKISELAAQIEDGGDEELAEALAELVVYLKSLYKETRQDRERILVVDDSDEIRLMLGVILDKQGYDVTTVETAQKGIDLLTEEDFDLMILDLVLPDMDGRNFLIKLRENQRTAHLPVLVLSAKNSAMIKAECFALGADDYFEKPLDPALLTTRVAGTLQRSKSIEKQTRLDHLTELPNRAAFTETYTSQSKLAFREDTPLCIAMLDIDNFKNVNDTYGHPVGDKVLQHISRHLKAQLRESDILARWGGEEFAALLPATTEDEGKIALKKVLQFINQTPFTSDPDLTIPLGFSGGVYQVKKGEDLNTVFAQADALLYQAKASGRNCIMASHDDVEVQATKILLAEDDDLTAEFILHRLRKDGFEIEHFDRGDAALEAARTEKYDLAIFDVKMPGMEGFELLQRTRADSLNQSTPVIMLTSMGSEHDISRGLKLGANDYVLKPFSPMELMARIRRLLK